MCALAGASENDRDGLSVKCYLEQGGYVDMRDTAGTLCRVRTLMLFGVTALPLFCPQKFLSDFGSTGRNIALWAWLLDPDILK